MNYRLQPTAKTPSIELKTVDGGIATRISNEGISTRKMQGEEKRHLEFF